MKQVVPAILDQIRFPPSSFPRLRGLIKVYLNLGGLIGNILEKKCLNYCCFATFSVGWGGVEWLDKLEIKPTQPHLKFGLELGLSLAILCK